MVLWHFCSIMHLDLEVCFIHHQRTGCPGREYINSRRVLILLLRHLSHNHQHHHLYHKLVLHHLHRLHLNLDVCVRVSVQPCSLPMIALFDMCPHLLICVFMWCVVCVCACVWARVCVCVCVCEQDEEKVTAKCLLCADSLWSAPQCVYVCVCVCVWEREKSKPLMSWTQMKHSCLYPDLTQLSLSLSLSPSLSHPLSLSLSSPSVTLYLLFSQCSLFPCLWTKKEREL